MTTYRMMAPAVGSSITVAGRLYVWSAGGTVDAPDYDMPVLRANGWQLVGVVGTTAQRPAVLPPAVSIYVDTTVNKALLSDGKTYRDHGGASS